MELMQLQPVECDCGPPPEFSVPPPPLWPTFDLDLDSDNPIDDDAQFARIRASCEHDIHRLFVAFTPADRVCPSLRLRSDDDGDGVSPVDIVPDGALGHLLTRYTLLALLVVLALVAVAAALCAVAMCLCKRRGKRPPSSKSFGLASSASSSGSHGGIDAAKPWPCNQHWHGANTNLHQIRQSPSHVPVLCYGASPTQSRRTSCPLSSSACHQPPSMMPNSASLMYPTPDNRLIVDTTPNNNNNDYYGGDSSRTYEEIASHTYQMTETIRPTDMAEQHFYQQHTIGHSQQRLPPPNQRPPPPPPARSSGIISDLSSEGSHELDAIQVTPSPTRRPQLNQSSSSGFHGCGSSGHTANASSSSSSGHSHLNRSAMSSGSPNDSSMAVGRESGYDTEHRRANARCRQMRQSATSPQIHQATSTAALIDQGTQVTPKRRTGPHHHHHKPSSRTQTRSLHRGSNRSRSQHQQQQQNQTSTGYRLHGHLNCHSELELSPPSDVPSADASSCVWIEQQRAAAAAADANNRPPPPLPTANTASHNMTYV